MKLRYILLLVAALVVAITLTQKDMQRKESLEKTAEVVAVEQAVIPTEDEVAPEEVAPEEVAPAEDRNESPAPFEISCKFLSDMMGTCEPYSCETPLKDGFMVEHTIAGLLPNGLCVHTQTAPGNKMIVCNYSQEMRIMMSKAMRTIKNPISEEEGKIIAAGFDAECEVVDTTTGEVIRRTAGGNTLELDTAPDEDGEQDPAMEEGVKEADDSAAKDIP